MLILFIYLKIEFQLLEGINYRVPNNNNSLNKRGRDSSISVYNNNAKDTNYER